MQVTFRPKEGLRDRWEILVDGEKWREVHRTIFGRNPVFPPLSAGEELKLVFDAFENRRVKAYVLWRLSTQSYHSEILAKLLRERLVQNHTVERVIEEMRGLGFLDDAAWLQSFFRIQQKRYSLPMILSKLRFKGLSSETLQSLAKEWINPEEEMQAIQRIIHTRYGKQDLSQFKMRQKVICALMRKGYTFDQVQTVLQQYLRDKRT